MPPRLHPLACRCSACRPAAGTAPTRFPIPASMRRHLLTARALLLAIFSR